MTRQRKPTEPRRLLEGGDGTRTARALAKGLEQYDRTPSDPYASRRVWQRTRSGRVDRPGLLGRRWPVAAGAALVVMLAVAFVGWWRFDSIDSTRASHLVAMVTLAAGQVQMRDPSGPERNVVAGDRMTPGASLQTGRRSRALVQLGSTAVLLSEKSEAVIGASTGPGAVTLRSGMAIAATRPVPGAVAIVFQVRVYEVRTLGSVFSISAGEPIRVAVAEGVVEINGPLGHRRVESGHCWQSNENTISPCGGPAETGLVKALARPMAGGARLEIRGDPRLEIRADGQSLGSPPLSWWAPLGRRELKGLDTAHELSGTVEVAPNQTNRFDFGTLVASDRHAQSSPEPDPLPPTKPPPAVSPLETDRTGTLERTQSPVAPRTSEMAAPDLPPIERLRHAIERAESDTERAELLYELGLELVAKGTIDEGLRALAELARGSGPRAEMALYEMARIYSRQRHDPKRALALLDEHQRRFSNGILIREARLTRIELLVGGDHQQQGIAAISGFLATFPQTERRAELLMMRGDLLRATGQPGAAVRDFQTVAELKPDTSVAEKAIFRAAVCAAQAGQLEQAHRLSRRYLHLFPQGEHAETVRKQLDEADAE